eukprot:364435-Chlamydomonas_euryale.AAC.13
MFPALLPPPLRMHSKQQSEGTACKEGADSGGEGGIAHAQQAAVGRHSLQGRGDSGGRGAVRMHSKQWSKHSQLNQHTLLRFVATWVQDSALFFARVWAPPVLQACPLTHDMHERGHLRCCKHVR